MDLETTVKRMVLLSSIFLVLILAGCGISPSGTADPFSPGSSLIPVSQLSGTITESGSSTVQPLAEKLANAFMAQHRNVKVIIQGGGSSLGIKAASDGTVDLGASSRELAPSDPVVVAHPLALDGIAIIVNPANPVSNLTKDQVRDIYSGIITNWSQVGGPDQNIHLSAREEGSGTRTAFEDLVMDDFTVVKKAILQPSSGALIQVVKSDPAAISFVSFGYLSNSVKALKIDGVAATEANVKSGAYPIVRSLYFLTKTEPEGLVKEFLGFCAGPDAEAIILSEGYVTVK